MADTYTSSLRVAQQTIGGNENSWGTILNASLQALDQGIAGIVSISVTAGNVTLSTANNADDQARNALIIFTGTPGTTRTVTMPDVEKLTWVYNNCSDGSSITLTAGAGTSVTVQAGRKFQVYTDGATNVVQLAADYVTGSFTPVFTAATPPSNVTYSVQHGRYQRIGNLVYVTGNVTLTSKGTGGAGDVRIDGLPLKLTLSGGGAVGPLATSATKTGGVDFVVYCGTSNVNYFNIAACGPSLGTSPLQWSDVANTDAFVFTLIYPASLGT